ncbi:glycerol-3-phosphate acyltransferase [Bacillus sp. AK031]
MMNIYMLVAVCLLSYGFGGLNGAYYVTGYYMKEDIRSHGSGNVGATNAGRILGKKGFVLTVILDVAKVIAALSITYWMAENDPTAMVLSAFFLLAGHIFPIQLGFQGGKGIVVFLACSLYLVPSSILVLGLIMGILFLITKKYKLSGFIAMLSIPLTAFLTDHPPEYWSVLLVMFGIVLLVHKKSPPRQLHNRQP